MFSSPFVAESEPPKNRLYQLRDEILASGGRVVDLASGNVNEHGIIFPQETLGGILTRAAEAARIYQPDPFGQPAARQAVAQFYGPLNLSPEQVLLTPGTSLSYWYCFKLLCEPGDEVLCPRPCYPLFEHIAGLAGVRLAAYRLVESRNWAMDLDYLDHQVSTRTRAIVLVSPHNPTGAVAGAEELAGLAAIAARHQLAVIADEVFSEFLFGLPSLPRAAATSAPLVFTLNGFSKMFALPGMKIGWIAITGDPTLVRRAASALELMSDTFLPVNEIAQFAVPEIFRLGQAFQRGYARSVAERHQTALGLLAGMEYVPPRGGFYLTLPINRNEDRASLDLLRHQRLLVHPGYFYDMEPYHLVVSFIHEPAALREHLRRVREYLEANT